MKKPQTILYVDDDLSSLLYLKEYLNQFNINVITENNGKCGLNTFQESKDDLDLIILDVHMNELNGYDLLISMRKTDKKIPIIMVSSNTFVQNRKDMIKLGANDYLIKPFDDEQFLKSLKRLLKINP